ncbi:hypothetical protein JRQ81_000883 [Phrynocephalus forsythii]|uniref:Egl-9 family hypoxia inducible factor 2 n=1 Tax=Phrynocephalus forsythii TaxID=171643 RepID=A0A9Q0Y6Z3_9SAUR|nr:hypothetical protein JRQ81_000883 [Phrynocephalus forsythii]
MASGGQAPGQPPPAERREDSVESMRAIFVDYPESSREDRGRRRREEQEPDGSSAEGPTKGSPEATVGPAGAAEARVVEGPSPGSGPPPPKRAPLREHRRDAPRLVSQYIVPCMDAYGLCLVDRFLGHRMAEKVFQEVLSLHLSGKFQDGALAGQKAGSSRDIRGDQILWVEGNEPGCENIGSLLKRMDKLIMYADGKLGHYKIRGRHKRVTVVEADMLGKNSSMAETTPPPPSGRSPPDHKSRLC